MDYKEVQAIAKSTIEYMKEQIVVGMNLIEIRRLCEEYMLQHGADSFWYWNVGAFVFSGEETTISVSGTQYVTSDKMILKNDIITIDLSPQNSNTWGDYARTIVIENSKVVNDINTIQTDEWKNGLTMEDNLHEKMLSIITPEMTFEELYFQINEYIINHGYLNLDFMGNLGHSIVKEKSDRVYIEKGNTIKFSEVAMFTFEPHISIPNSKYGYKKENIYFFDGEKISEL